VEGPEAQVGQEPSDHGFEAAVMVVGAGGELDAHGPRVMENPTLTKGKASAKLATTMDTLRQLISNPIFLSSLTAWFFAQFIKSLIAVVRFRSKMAKRDLLLTLIWTTGGMPSSHSAVVSALTTAVGFREGFASPLFIVSFFFSFMAIRDALGVRQAAGNQARALNQIIEDLNSRHGSSHKAVKEIHGHKGPEVIVGCLLGIFLATAFCKL